MIDPDFVRSLLILLIMFGAFGIVMYILNGIIFYRIGKKAGLDWAWVAWIPCGASFILARVVNWELWALFPILAIGMSVISWIPFIGALAEIAVAVFVIMQIAQLIMGYRRNALILLWNLIPIIGTIIYVVILFRMSSETPEPFVPRNWYGAKRQIPPGNNFSA